MRLMTDKEESELRSAFLKQIGNKIRAGRERKNISLETLAECIHTSTSSLSMYENGHLDMKISNLPVISTYCDFPLSDYYDADIEQQVRTFSKIVEITKKKYERKKIPVSIVEEDSYTYSADSTIIKPYSEPEFKEYLKNEFTKDEMEFLESAGKVIDYFCEISMKQTEDNKDNEELCTHLAETVVYKLIMEKLVKNPNENHLRAYAYYLKIAK